VSKVETGDEEPVAGKSTRDCLDRGGASFLWKVNIAQDLTMLWRNRPNNKRVESSYVPMACRGVRN
jgi:hypothetical protein